MALNVKALFSIAGAFKFLELVLAIVTFLLARVGYNGTTTSFGSDMDAQWIGHIATGGWLIIIPAVILGIFAGDEHPWRLDVILNLCGSVLYIAAGSLAISFHNSEEALTKTFIPPVDNKTVDVNTYSGVALGSFCVITGIVLLFDTVLLVVKNVTKKN